MSTSAWTRQEEWAQLLESSGMSPASLGSHGSDGSLRPLPGPGTQVGRSLGLRHQEQENGLDQAWLPAATPGLPLCTRSQSLLFLRPLL